MRYEIRPLGRWDRPVTEHRASAGRFRVGWSDALEHLGREITALGGSLAVIQIDAPEQDIRRDGMLRSRAKVGFPGVKISFESRHGPLTYATDAYQKFYAGDLESWQANVRAITLGLEALRAVDRYGITRSGEQYRGWTQIEAGPGGGTSRDDAATVLLSTTGIDVRHEHLLTDPEAVRKAYRSAAKRHHPDNGGSDEVFRRIVQARDVLLDGAR